MRKKVDEQTKQKIIEMTKQNKTNAEIMLECHVGTTVIKQTRAEAGLKYEGAAFNLTGGSNSNESSTLKNISNEDFEKLVELVINEINAREELSAKIEKLSAESAHIGHASIDVLDNKQSKDFILHIKAMGDDPERDEVCDYEKALKLIMDVDRKDEDTAKFILDHYDNAKKRSIRRITIMPNHGQQFKNLNDDVSNWNEAYQKLNERINDLESKL